MRRHTRSRIVDVCTIEAAGVMSEACQLVSYRRKGCDKKICGSAIHTLYNFLGIRQLTSYLL